MEYALLGLLSILGELWDTLFGMEVSGAIPLGGIIIACIILSKFLNNFKMSGGSSSSAGSKSAGSSSGSPKESEGWW